MLHFVHRDDHPPAKWFSPCGRSIYDFIPSSSPPPPFLFISNPNLFQNDPASGLGKKVSILINKMQVFSWSPRS